MTLKERLDADLREAMKAREAGKIRLSVIRMVKAANKNAEIAKGETLDDERVAEVLAKELKVRQESLSEFEKGGRSERVAELREEMGILQAYLPEQLSADQVEDIARQVIIETGAAGTRDMGRVMSALMPRIKGRADGRLVNETVKKLLEGVAK